MDCLVSKKDVFYMLILLSMCGNVFVLTYVTSFMYVIVASFFIFKIVYKKIFFSLEDALTLYNAKKIILCSIFLFCLQYLTFGWNTFPGLVNHISRIIVGLGFVLYFGHRFKIVLFQTMYYICLVVLPLWAIQNITGRGIGGWTYNMGKTIFLYSYRESDLVRNCGFFWEPGAMGGYIVFLVILFFPDLNVLFKTYKKECIIILLTLLSTQSTGAYISFGVTLIFYLFFSLQSKWKYVFLPIAFVGSFFVYQNTEFLQEKVESQNSKTAEMKIGDYNASRSGSIMFDLHYIKKHPFIGNGLHERTRFKDHPVVWQQLMSGDLAAAGNGFSDQLAKWGVVYFFVFFGVFFSINRNLEYKEKISILFLFVLLLQGECFLNYPLFQVFPLIRLKNNYSLNYNANRGCI